MNILCVEGNVYQREVLEEYFLYQGHQVKCYLPRESVYKVQKDVPQFNTPQELVDLVHSSQPHAIILDRETFSPSIQGDDGLLLKKYVEIIQDNYAGPIVIKATKPLFTESGFKSIYFYQDEKKVWKVSKPFLLEQLCALLEDQFSKRKK